MGDSDEEDYYEDSDDEDDAADEDNSGSHLHPGAVPAMPTELEEAYKNWEDDLDLDDITEELLDQTSQISAFEQKMQLPNVSKLDVDTGTSQLPSIFGNLEDLQYELDALTLDSEEDRLRRKQMLGDIEALFVRIKKLGQVILIVGARLSDQARVRGNEFFKAGAHVQAIKSYDEAISLDPHNSVLLTNRALAKQKINQIDAAIVDAKKAVEQDTSMLKGYVILIKCYVAKGQFSLASDAFGSIPLAYDSRPEVVELRSLTSQGAKDLGNAHFKDGKLDDAIGQYSVAIKLDPRNHLLYSNRSATYQSKKMWEKAAADAETCLDINLLFAKGYVHLARCQVQLKRWGDALATVNNASCALGSVAPSDLAGIQPQLNQIVESIELGQSGRAPANASRSAQTPMSDLQRAEALKERGNQCYKEEEYQDAIRFYSQAIAICPSEGAYLGNRAAAWLMIKEFKRAAADSAEGLKLEKVPGSLDKLRQRQATAMANMGDVVGAIRILEDAIVAFPASAANFHRAVSQLRQAQIHSDAGYESLEKAEFSRAKRLFQLAQQGAGDNPTFRLGCARCHLALGEYDDASREAQKVISTTGGAGQISVDAYLCRAEALQATGATDLASKHLIAALQMDPDNQAIQLKVKSLRKVISETTRVRGEIDEQMNKRDFEKAVRCCNDGLQIEKAPKKLLSEMHYRRAFAYSKMAKVQARAAPSADEDEASSPKRLAEASWRRVLQDCNAAIYYDTSATSISYVFLKCEGLQALERYEEAVSELENCYNTGAGKEERTVREKLKEAQFILKKSKRVDLYAILGASRGEMSTEAEIKKSYKKSALKWHPDRHSAASEADKKKAEATFKEINDAYELLTDPARKKLWDQGYDRAEIEEKLEQEKQRQQHGGHRHGW